MPRIFWYVGGVLLGHGEVESFALRPDSIAYSCPHCGEIWARKHIPGSERWVFPCAPCPNCPPYYDTYPGSLSLGHSEPIEQLPLAVLEHELRAWALSQPTGAKA